MANESIYRAFEREHEHIALALSAKAEKEHEHNSNEINTSDIDYSFTYVSNTDLENALISTDETLRGFAEEIEAANTYTQHCWLKETYTIENNSSITETKLTATNTLVSVAQGVQTSIQYSTELSNDGALVNPYTVILGCSSITNGIPYFLTIESSTDSNVGISSLSCSSLLTRWNTLANTAPLYVKVDNKLYRLYNNVYAATGTLGTQGISATYSNNGNYPSSPSALLALGGASSYNSNYTYDNFELNVSNESLKQTLDTQILYTDSANSFVEGDDGNGTIYTYLGIPSEIAPLAGNFYKHCWRKRGYGYYPEANSNISYVAYSAQDVIGAGDKVGIAYNITVNDDKLVPSSDAVLYDVTRETSNNLNNASGNAAIYNDLCVGVYRIGGSPTYTWSYFTTYIQSLLNQNSGIVYMSIGATSATDWSTATVYRITNINQLYVRSNYTYHATNADQYDYYLDFVNISKCSVATGDEGGYDSTYEGIDEIIYTPVEDAFVAGDDGQGLIYTYYGIPAYEWMSNKAAGSSSSNNAAKIATGSYPGSGTYGSSNANSLTFDFKPKLVFINYTSDSISSSYDKHYSVVFNTEILSTNYMNNAAIVHSTQEGQSTLSSGALTAKLSGNTLSWYNLSTAESQLNMSGCTYHYVAIG